MQTFLALSRQSEYCYLLESAEGPRKLAQYSFIGFSPEKIVEVKDGRYTETSPGNGSTTIQTDDPYLPLRKTLAENFTTYHGFRFVGGLVGYFSYDAIRYLESIPVQTRDDLKLPDFEFGVYDDGIVFDHLNGQAYYYWYNKNRLKEIERLLAQRITPTNLASSVPSVNLKQEEFESKVDDEEVH